MKKNILADGRWTGKHGIGRFSFEILTRLKDTDIIEQGPKPLSLKGLIWQMLQLHRKKKNYRVFFTPGFNPVYHATFPYVLTICDLIYLHTPGWKGLIKKIFFEFLIKSSIKKAAKVITISDYSKKSILTWTHIPEEKIINVSCGISSAFQPEGARYCPGYAYLLHVGNAKTHKNIERLLRAFADANIPRSIKLLFTCQSTPTLARLIQSTSLKNRVHFLHALSEYALANCYRGAIALTFPSLYEGFGLPILEAMACGTPVLTSDATSCPEIAGDAAILVDAMSITSIKKGIESMVNDTALRATLIAKGLERAKHYSWDQTAAKVQQALDQIVRTDNLA